MSNSPLVSVVIPAYNRADTLADAIESAKAQTYNEIEIVVVDDGSTDETPQLIENYPNVKYHRQKNRGANAARNMGVERSEGVFVAFLDADDLWKPKKIEQQVNEFDKATEKCGLVHTGIEIRDFSGDVIDQVTLPDVKNSKRRLLLGNYIGTFSSILVYKRIFDEIGHLNEGLPSWQDWEFYLRIADEYDFEVVREPLTIKRSGKENQISRDLDSLLNTTYPFFESLISGQADEYGAIFQRRAIARLRMEVGDAALMHGDASVARQYLALAIISSPFESKVWAYFLLSLLGTDVYRKVLSTKRQMTT